MLSGVQNLLQYTYTVRSTVMLEFFAVKASSWLHSHARLKIIFNVSIAASIKLRFNGQCLHVTQQPV